ncbi:transcription factor Spi-B-like [Corythoichthys intestinalis]|uniref:transcription factor Spi-B-like n=1 Tax=Corythoichthys intestinalis TaxID=161448 RepID=UPI0025A524D8|nr:transcription factor Spi-B-like [Corythoichthys intestinalis]
MLFGATSRSAMNSCQEAQSDLEVILEFLEEYHRQNAENNGVQENTTSEVNDDWEHCWRPCEPLHTPCGPPAAPCEPSSASVTMRQLSTQQATVVGSGRKMRLFHFLFEMLEDPTMAHCVSWVPSSSGVFRFSARNKDQLAALWGQRKGNKRPMTYQKMSRALRNYARSGEIVKVKKKLTYQFGERTLMLLHKHHRGDL